MRSEGIGPDASACRLFPRSSFLSVRAGLALRTPGRPHRSERAGRGLVFAPFSVRGGGSGSCRRSSTTTGRGRHFNCPSSRRSCCPRTSSCFRHASAFSWTMPKPGPSLSPVAVAGCGLATYELSPVLPALMRGRSWSVWRSRGSFHPWGHRNPGVRGRQASRGKPRAD